MNSSKGPPSSRRATKTLSASQQKAVEEKRLRGELSCAECRRLKLRCDRQVPCGSCSRRGCASICPSGVLEAGAGHVHQGGMRVGQLRTKIGIMASRIRELEAALGEGHALLEERLLRIGRIDEEPPEEPGSISQLEGLGTLTLGEEGEASYFGSSGGNESLIAREMMLYSNSNEDDDSDESSLNPSPELFTAVAGSSVSDEEAILPSEEEGRSLALAYCATGALFFRAWKREELFDEVIPKVYGPGGASAHLQSALFFVFALGAYLSPRKVNGLHEEQAEIWFQRGRAAFQKKDKKRNSPEDTIRALGLMGTYFSMASRHHSRDSAWAALALAAKLCQGAGLHRDPARWNLPSALVQRRRALFWEVYQSDISHSIALGRPPTTPLSFVDCEYPDEDPMSHQDICNLKYRYSRDAFIPIMDLVLSAYPTKRSYREVVELDAKIRKLQVPIPPSDNGLKTFFANQLLNAVILTLHRSYMARAILNGKAAAKGEDPNKPFDPFDSAQTPYAPSVTAAYHAAEEISRSLHGFAVTDSEIAGRVWFLTYHGFSAALVLGALASRAPGSTYAPTAIMTLSLVVDGVFAKYVHVSARHRTAFVLLRRLKTRAIRRYTAFLESKAGTRSESGNHGDAGVVGNPDGDPGHIGLGPGAVNPDDPTFRIKLDSDPESDFEEPVHQRTHPSEPSAPSTNETGGLATFEGKIAMFGGKTNVLLSLKGKKGKSGLKRKKTEYEGSVSVSSPESFVAASPESTTSTHSDIQGISTTSSSIIEEGGRPPNRSSAQAKGMDSTQGMSEVTNHSINPSSMDVFMADTNMQELGTDSAFDGMEGIENLNVDAFSFGYDNFGTDAGSGIVMGMALEDIGMGTNIGMSSFALGSSPASTTSAGTSGSTSFGSTELQSHEGSTSSAFNVYQQHYGGGFAVRTSLSPEASGSSPPTQPQEPDEEQEPLTATAQAARMFGMGSHSYPFLTSNSNANNTDIGQSYAASSSNEYSNLNVFTTYTKQQLAVGSAQGQPQPPKSSSSIQSSTSYLQQQQQSQPTTSSHSPTNYNSASFDPPTNSQTGHSHPQSQNTSSLTSSFAPSSSVSPLLGDPAQLYARFAEFMSQKAASSPPHTQHTQTMSQIPQEAQQQRQNVQGYTPVPNSYNYYGFAGNANGYFGPSGPQSMNSNPNPNGQATDFEYNADFDAFLRSFRTPDAGIGSTLTGGGGYVLPYGQMYGQWQDQTHSGGT